MLNNQKPEKLKLFEVEENPQIDLHSIFHTIQGEGPFCGVPCVFIRLAGCNLQCPKCDTDYTNGRRLTTVKDIVKEVKKIRDTGLVVVTGGEPFRQSSLSSLFQELVHEGYYIQVETNGTLPIPLGMTNINTMVLSTPASRFGVYIVCSPKTGKVHSTIAENACCMKYVGGAQDLSHKDGLPMTALGHTAKPYLYRTSRNIPVYLQPLDDKNPLQNKLNIDSCVQSCLKFGYTLQLQIHKYLGVE